MLNFLIFLAFLLVSSVAWRLYKIRHFRGLPRTPVSELQEGVQACVVGEALVPQPLNAPISGKRCVAWRLEIRYRLRQHYAGPGRNRDRWKDLFAPQETTPFAIRTQEGEIVTVRCGGYVKLLLQRDRVNVGRTNRALELLDRFNIPAPEGDYVFVAHESCAEVGEEVAVIGTPRVILGEAKSGGDYRQMERERHFVMGEAGTELTITDDPWAIKSVK